MPDPLFFIALLPDEETQVEVTEFKLECAGLFEARHALKSPPHLTLQSPFRWQPERLEELKQSLSDFAADQLPFRVGLKDFNCFQPRVLFVDVVKNDDLKELHDELARHLYRTVGLKNKRSHGFNPHMTIAHKDLRADVFPHAWEHFSRKKYNRTFLANRITLLRHRKGKWEVEETFLMEN